MSAIISPTVFASIRDELAVALRISSDAGEVVVLYERPTNNTDITLYTSVPNSENTLVETIQESNIDEYLQAITKVRDESATVITDTFDLLD